MQSEALSYKPQKYPCIIHTSNTISTTLMIIIFIFKYYLFIYLFVYLFVITFFESAQEVNDCLWQMTFCLHAKQKNKKIKKI